MKTVRYSNQQILICGNVCEVRTSPTWARIDPLPQSRPPFQGSISRKIRSQRKEESLHRSRRELQRLINSNIGFHLKPSGKPYLPLFITYTFANNMTDLKQANYYFTKFIQRFNYALFGKKQSILKYVVAIEFQKRGAVHYHTIFFNIPYRVHLEDFVANIWQVGFIKIKSVKEKHIRDIGSYLTKYMTKEQFDKRLVGNKCYFSSKNLFRPVLVKEVQKVEMLKHFLKPEQKFFEKPIAATDYSPEYLLQKYNVNNPGFVRGILDLIVKGRYVES